MTHRRKQDEARSRQTQRRTGPEPSGPACVMLGQIVAFECRQDVEHFEVVVPEPGVAKVIAKPCPGREVTGFADHHVGGLRREGFRLESANSAPVQNDTIEDLIAIARATMDHALQKDLSRPAASCRVLRTIEGYLHGPRRDA
ncbi:hypothetical protein AS156_24905 [Bradyrhizobium macuxiense]|uniref:Uncharacterized protein n=1 Tax=Bradyrhizobium macuxiense TaxID=1755647 RepID=A0A109J768_9BRAD|nr:hypothetical protein AS156_24905 [Bradyrhizobium macuxiense]